MKLKELGEFRFIDRITAGCLVRKEGVIKAIGDDDNYLRCRPVASGNYRTTAARSLRARPHFSALTSRMAISNSSSIVRRIC